MLVLNLDLLIHLLKACVHIWALPRIECLLVWRDWLGFFLNEAEFLCCVHILFLSRNWSHMGWWIFWTRVVARVWVDARNLRNKAWLTLLVIWGLEFSRYRCIRCLNGVLHGSLWCPWWILNGSLWSSWRRILYGSFWSDWAFYLLNWCLNTLLDLLHIDEPEVLLLRGSRFLPFSIWWNIVLDKVVNGSHRAFIIFELLNRGDLGYLRDIDIVES